MALLANLLTEFYACELPYFPVVEASTSLPQKTGKKKGKTQDSAKLVGFVTRKNLDLWVSDLSRLGHKHQRIPKEILNHSLEAAELLKFLPNGQSLPVFNTEGVKVAFWSENQLIQALGQLPEKTRGKTFKSPQTSPLERVEVKSLFSEQKERLPSRVSENSLWLSNLILGAFPWPLYACDLQGKTLFFNRSFEERVLKKTKLKNSLKRAESYLMEMVRNLLTQSFMEDVQNKDERVGLGLYDKFLSHYVRIVNLEEKSHVHGYLFIFQEGEDPAFAAEIKRHLASGNSLDEIISEIEGNIIFNALRDHERNISHTAKALRIKRSTLQNKIQRLRVGKRFSSIQAGPIPRHRSSSSHTSEEKSQAKKKTAVKKTKASSTLKQPFSKKESPKLGDGKKQKLASSKVVHKKKNPQKSITSLSVPPQKEKQFVQKKPGTREKIADPVLQKRADDSPKQPSSQKPALGEKEELKFPILPFLKSQKAEEKES